MQHGPNSWEPFDARDVLILEHANWYWTQVGQAAHSGDGPLTDAEEDEEDDEDEENGDADDARDGITGHRVLVSDGEFLINLVQRRAIAR